MKTKLILAVFLAAAVIPQSALAFGAVWKYGGNWGHGKGVGAVANYATQKEADREALKQCEEKRPHWAKKNNKYGCVVVERLHNNCASFGRYAIIALWSELNSSTGWADKRETHSSAIFYHLGKNKYSANSVNACWKYHNKAAYEDYRGNVDPNYHKKYDDRDDITFVWNELHCNSPVYNGLVCDAVK
ncbi:MAG: DUF4189 domain-containing protein [Betaproteobacteria bacterium]|nr:DUF4189 domain-containing protein [Betaproteobacteria bacterium]